MLTKKILGALLTVALLLSFVGLTAEAAGMVDTAQSGSLSLTYSYNGQAFSGIRIRIYRVASVSQFADFSLQGSFSQLPVEVNNIKSQDEWRQLASTLSSYVTSKAIACDSEAVTDRNGTVSFPSLPLGLYLVEGVRVEQENGYCQFDSFMLSLPNLDENDQWVYNVTAKPKSSFQEVKPKEITYTVNKLWKDQGFEHLRPQTVSVQLYRNGSLMETVTLSADNNWHYSWTTTDDGALWQVVEAAVPNGYRVTMEQKNTFFFVTNGYNDPSEPPPTGDFSNIQVYLIIMCVAGMGLIALGLTGLRKRKL